MGFWGPEWCECCSSLCRASFLCTSRYTPAQLYQGIVATATHRPAPTPLAPPPTVFNNTTPTQGVDGQPVANAKDLLEQLDAKRVGDKVSVEVLRGRQRLQFTLQLADRKLGAGTE